MSGEAEGEGLRSSPGVPDFAALVAAMLATERRTGQRIPAVYLAGPMTGIHEWNHAAFDTTAAVLRARDTGPRVHSPAELFAGDTNRPREHYMRAGLDLLVGASSAQPFRPRPTDVVLLPGWEDSRGAVVEVLVAQELGLRVWRPDGSLLPAAQRPVSYLASFDGVVIQWPRRCATTQGAVAPVKRCGASYSISSAPPTARDVRDLPVEGDGDSTVHVTPRMASLPRSVGQAGCSGHHAELVRLGQQVQAAGRRIEGAALLGDTVGASAAAEGLDELAALVISETMVEGCR